MRSTRTEAGRLLNRAVSPAAEGAHVNAQLPYLTATLQLPYSYRPYSYLP